jgi:hypothetical protein
MHNIAQPFKAHGLQIIAQWLDVIEFGSMDLHFTVITLYIILVDLYDLLLNYRIFVCRTLLVWISSEALVQGNPPGSFSQHCCVQLLRNLTVKICSWHAIGSGNNPLTLSNVVNSYLTFFNSLTTFCSHLQHMPKQTHVHFNFHIINIHAAWIILI